MSSHISLHSRQSFTDFFVNFSSLQNALHEAKDVQNTDLAPYTLDLGALHKACDAEQRPLHLDTHAHDLQATYALINERQHWNIEKITKYLKESKEHTIADLLSLGFLALDPKPYPIQVLAAIALLNHRKECKGQIAQVRTGEGKSLIVTLTAFVLAMQGRKVDIISCSSYLARRDQKKFSSFFSKFELTTSHICEHLPPDERFKAHIVYGTNYDFEFALLRAWLPNKRTNTQTHGILQRGQDCALVDEVDNLFIDIAMNSARIAISKNGHQERLWPIFLDAVKTAAESSQSEKSAFFNRICQPNTILSKLITSVPLTTITSWMASAKHALYDLHEGVDYVIKPQEGIKKPKIVIIDKHNTGRRKEMSRWSDGLHQFLECKHGLVPEEETLMPASISHVVYFSRYNNLYGLTGTVGDECERKEITTLYSVESFDLPPHRLHRGQQLPTTIMNTRSEHLAFLTSEVLKMPSRPLLILFSTIEECEKFSMHLDLKQVTHRLLHDNQLEDEDYIIQCAGKPGAVTIATNTAGRGTDIILSPLALQNGGLHVIVTFYPANDRVLAQAFGRAARQGQPGTYQLIVSREEESVCQFIDTNEPDFSLEQLAAARTKQIQTLSNKRLECSKLELKRQAELETFVTRLQDFRQSISDEWIEAASQKFGSSQPNQLLAEQPEIAELLTCVERSHTVWKAIFTQTRDVFLDAIVEDWSSSVYEQISDDIQMQELCKVFWNKWGPRMIPPEEGFYRYFAACH